jgi:crotonobetainyl-CoA:carnitine CoA-transferase CaiB-like acyl-CoA transferase
VQATLCGETVAVQPLRTQSPHPLRNHYRCADGRWLLLSIVPDQRRWEAFRKALGSGLLADPRFATPQGRVDHAQDLTAVLDQIFATRPLTEWRAILDASGLVFGVVAEMGDIAEDEQMRVSGALVPFADAELLTVSSPFWVAGYEKAAPRLPPKVGEHSDDVLRAAGYGEEEIRAMRTDGVIG